MRHEELDRLGAAAALVELLAVLELALVHRLGQLLDQRDERAVVRAEDGRRRWRR